ncbi:MAG: hypothetical protein QOH06_5028 [Acidobacteriota bacterium]|nr:hypothetical protein [Acidobacteriota bacterium]
MRHLFFLMILALAAYEASPSPDAAPVVIELFTSQGCSSCPPADRLLTRLAGDPRVIPLSFHVDYWNYIGWTDPFSSKRWSERQQGYARAFRSNRIYTPQLVVSGRTGLNGADEAGARKRIAEALAAEPAGRVTLSMEPAQDRLTVKVGAKLSRAVEGPLDLWVAVYETGLTTKVGAGENASATLHNDYVVRRLEKALTLPGTAGAADSGEVVLGLDKRWKRESLGVAAFLQDPKTMVIYGAGAKPLAP